MKLIMHNAITVIILFMCAALVSAQISYADDGDALFASSSIDIFSCSAHTKKIGSLEIGAKVYVLQKKGNWFNVKIKGWRQKGLPSVIYAFMGKRIVKAELTPKGEKILTVIKTIKDKDTELIWEEAELNSAWIDSKHLVDNMDNVWLTTSHLFHERCSMCHALPKSTTFTANQWPATLKVMTKRAALDKTQADVVSKFLQYHAKDTINLTEE